jgi:SAM-dependent methyltransferase
MKLCLACNTAFSAPDWICPACGWIPRRQDGFVLFAPELAAANDGMLPDAHDKLDTMQEGSFWFRARNRLIADLVERWFSQARTTLEVGCGTGYVLRGLRQALPSTRLAGSEIYASGLPYARRRLGADVDLFQMDARAIPYVSEFDLICAFDVLEHVDEDEAVLRQMHTALAPGGGILLSVPQHPALWSRTDDFACHKRRYRTRELSAKCRAAGFKVVATTSFVFSLLPVMFAQRLSRGKRPDYNLWNELTLPRGIDRSFELLLEAERRLIGLGISFPAGGSRFVVAKQE